MLNTTILVDDSEIDRYLARRAVNKAGLSKRILEFPDAVCTLEFLSNREAFEKECGPWPPCTVVLLDINMPRMNGFEFLETLESRIKAGELPEGVLTVVMYSSSDFRSDVDRALSHDIVKDYIVKPITVETVVRIANHPTKR